jgi:hypothetical protein
MSSVAACRTNVVCCEWPWVQAVSLCAIVPDIEKDFGMVREVEAPAETCSMNRIRDTDQIVQRDFAPAQGRPNGNKVFFGRSASKHCNRNFRPPFDNSRGCLEQLAAPFTAMTSDDTFVQADGTRTCFAC